MATRIGDDTRARIAAAWPDLITAVATGASIGAACERAGVSTDQVRVYRIGDAQAEKEWAFAREQSADAYADQISEMINSPMPDSGCARVRMDALRWLASKRNPRVYSDKQQIDMTVRTVDLTAIIQAANARLARAREPITIEHEVAPAALLTHCNIADLM